MLKFFRQYMNYILAVFVTLLMVAFLIQPTLNMLGPSPTGEIIGQIGSDEVTIGDQRQANAQLQILQQIAPVLLHLTSNTVIEPTSGLQWILMLRDAQAMGLAASDAEVDLLLSTLGRDGAQLSQLAHRLGVSVDALRKTLGSWIMIQLYKELVAGLVHTPFVERFSHYQTARQFLQYGYDQGAAIEIESAFNGTPRLSRPLLERFLVDHRATVQIASVAISGQKYFSKVNEVDEETLKDLFNRYKQDRPGQSKPYGLGYRIPNRVKIEYLTIPFEKLRRQIRIDEADALSYYDNHQDEFRTQSPTPQSTDITPLLTESIQSYQEVRQQIVDRIKDQEASQTADRMIKTAQSMLLEDARGLVENGGYRMIPQDWHPMELGEIAQQLEKQFDVAPEVHRRDQQWLNESELAQLDSIGSSSLSTSQKTVPFVNYVLSAKEILALNSINTFSSLRLQVSLPSMPLKSASGNRHLFRLRDAQASGEPNSVDDVRPQVTHDAKRLAAYELLKEQSTTWLAQAKAKGLKTWAIQEDLKVNRPAPFPKRVPGRTGRFVAPNVSGLGNTERLIDGIFDLADRISLSQVTAQNVLPSDAGDFQDLSESQRIEIFAVDRLMSLVVVRVDRLQAMSRSNFKGFAQSPRVGAWINQSLVSRQTGNPLSVISLSKRVGFKPAYESE